MYPRTSFLEKWVFVPNCYCSDTNGWSCAQGSGECERMEDCSLPTILILYIEICASRLLQKTQANMTVDVSYGEKFIFESLKLIADELQAKPTTRFCA